MKSIYESYKGLPCVSREIDPKTWTWVYLYENKNAKKNKQQYDTLDASLKILREKVKKYQDDIDAIYDKFYKATNLTNESCPSVDINDACFDEVKGILTMRNKFNKSVKLKEESDIKLNNVISLMKYYKEDGFDELVKVPSKDMVYAYDMQNYVRLHPEEFNKNKN